MYHYCCMDQTLGTVVLIGGGIGLLALLRRLSRPVDAAILEAPKVPTLPFPAADEPDDDQSRLRIRNHYFRSFDSDTGPPEPECFYDELFLELENPAGDAWTISYFVGTPNGIAQVMREEGWDEMFGTDLLIVRRFDRELILKSLLDRLEEQHEIAPEPPRDPHLG
ncbi:MAG: hypothetical protein ACLP2H_18280 [Terriglobales bacterium]